MTSLVKEMAAYEEMRAHLEIEHLGEWVVFYEETLIGTYPTFQEAAADATQRFGRGPYLIRKVGEGPIKLPASVLYRPIYA